MAFNVRLHAAAVQAQFLGLDLQCSAATAVRWRQLCGGWLAAIMYTHEPAEANVVQNLVHIGASTAP